MSERLAVTVQRWTPASVASVTVVAVLFAVLAAGPFLLGANAIDKLTTLFVYVILAVMWNALAGYGGLVSVGQQAFFGLGAYAAVRLAAAGVSVYPALVIGALIVGVVSLPVSAFMLRLKGGEFAIGMWVVAELAHLLVNLDSLVQGETGTSLIALNAYAADTRHALTYWMALGAMIALMGALFLLLRSRFGASIQAIRDDEEGAAAVGVRVLATKRIVFVLAATGAAMAGALWLATTITFQPKTYFGVQWTAYMIFMVLVGGLGTFEGAILGAVLFFLIEAWFGALGVWYLVVLGATALLFSLFVPRGIWGLIEERWGLRLLPVGYRLVQRGRPQKPGTAGHVHGLASSAGAGTGHAARRNDSQRPSQSCGLGDNRVKSGEANMDIRLLIDGGEVAAAGGATFERKDPFTGKVATRAAAARVADAVAAADAAAAAFPAWAEMGPNQRRTLLLKASEIMQAKVGEFTRLMLEETGATAPWAGFNVMLASQMLREAASMTTQITGEVIPSDKPGTLALAVRQPAGVVLGMAPWNAPVILGTRALAMPLACGNTVVLKASEVSPGVHTLIGQVLVEAGLPKGVINVVTNAPADAHAIVEALIAHPAVKRVNFTGSTRVGRIIAELAGRHLKPALLELGGKAPLIVLDDADIDAAVDAITFGAFMNQGQICMSTERIIVDEKVADELVAKLAAKASHLPAGDPRGHVVLGSLVDLAPAERMDAFIKDATGQGGKVVAGGKRTGTVVEATIIDRVTPAMRIYSEESFGPVKPIIRVKGVDEAVRVANDTEYGLSSAVFGADIMRAMAVAKRIHAGICHINGPTLHDEAQMPFGGVGGSGHGRFGGKAAIAEFTDLRWITIEDPKQHYPF